MKKIPGSLPLKAYYAIISRKVDQISTSYKKCLIGGDSCTRAIKSHSVPVAALENIAVNGHVYAIKSKSPTYDELEAIYNNYKYQPKPCGINEASTYHSFCSSHDDSLFTEIEKHNIEPTNRQTFLSHFRAHSKALYHNITNNEALQEIYNAKLPDNHNPKDALANVASNFQPQAETFSDLYRIFESMKSDLASGNLPVLNSILIRIGCIPDVMCSTIFTPIFDIDGNFLLHLTNHDKSNFFPTMSITISKDYIGGFILLVWRPQDILTSAFTKIFITSNYDLNRLIAVIFGNTGNFFFSRDWWNNLSDDKKEMLMYFASIGYLQQVDSKRDHLSLMYGFVLNHQKIYINWPITSVILSNS